MSIGTQSLETSEKELVVLTRYQKKRLKEHNAEISCDQNLTVQHNTCGREWPPQLRADGKLPYRFYVCPHCNDYWPYSGDSLVQAETGGDADE